MWVEYNLNPLGSDIGDCVIRALSVVTDNNWDEVYIRLTALGFEMKDMPSSNAVWGEYLRRLGFTRHAVEENYTVQEFCYAHPHGTYVLATGTHVIAVRDGDYFDSWNSGLERPMYLYRKEE